MHTFLCALMLTEAHGGCRYQAGSTAFAGESIDREKSSRPSRSVAHQTRLDTQTHARTTDRPERPRPTTSSSSSSFAPLERQDEPCSLVIARSSPPDGQTAVGSLVEWGMYPSMGLLLEIRNLTTSPDGKRDRSTVHLARGTGLDRMSKDQSTVGPGSSVKDRMSAPGSSKGPTLDGFPTMVHSSHLCESARCSHSQFSPSAMPRLTDHSLDAHVDSPSYHSSSTGFDPRLW